MPDQLPSKEGAAPPIEDALNPTSFAVDPSDGQPATEEIETVEETPKVQVEDGEDVDVKVKSRSFSDFLNRGKDPEPEPEPEVEAKDPPPVDKDPNVRDLADIDEADRKFFKSMSNQSYNALKPIYLERKKLAAERSQLQQELEKSRTEKLSEHPSYYEHPQGYMLSNEYQQLYFDAAISEQLRDHWERQAIAIRRGDDWAPAEFNPKTGQLVVGEKRASDAEAEALVTRNVNNSQRQALQFANKLDSYVNGYNSRQKSAVEEIKKAEASYFPGYDDEKHPTAKTQKEIREMLGVFKDSPLAGLAVKASAALIMLNQANLKLQQELKALKGTKEDVQKAPPTKNKLKAGGGNTINSGRKFSDFERIRYQG